MDPERLIQCPLVKHHWIRARRFPYHLVKCKESNPEIAKKLATCPFNARHLVPQADLSNHIMKCNDKDSDPSDSPSFPLALPLPKPRHKDFQEGWNRSPKMLGEKRENPCQGLGNLHARIPWDWGISMPGNSMPGFPWTG
uniref:CHHC U11-48K-type domain-containing protein n=1 Tax=Zonotrichia albicollis TaxID=44394 RepID=A0A8D2NHD7_ZONAL